MTDNVEDFLAHYGVEGMHWGVRKTVNGKPRTPRYSKRELAERKRRKVASQKRRVLTDKDLDRLVDRLQKEKKLKDLTDHDLAPGRTVAKTLLTTAGTAVAAVVVTGAIKYGIKSALTRSFSLKDAASYLIPKPKK